MCPPASSRPPAVRLCCAFLFVAATQNLACSQSTTQARDPARALAVCQLQDTVAQLLAQHELCVLRHTQQHGVEFQSAVRTHAHDAACAQQADEVPEHRTIEELRSEEH